MSLDQVFMRLADRKILRKHSGRKVKMGLAEATSLVGKDGRLKAVARDGKVIRGTIGGKSKTQLAREALAKQEEQEKRKQQREARKKKRKRRRERDHGT